MDLFIYELDEIVFEDNYMKDMEISFKFDLICFIILGDYKGELKMGIKYCIREKDRDS